MKFECTKTGVRMRPENVQDLCWLEQVYGVQFGGPDMTPRDFTCSGVHFRGKYQYSPVSEKDPLQDSIEINAPV